MSEMQIKQGTVIEGLKPRIRGFEVVRDNCRKFPNEQPIIPSRKTTNSMGYDFAILETVTILPGTMHAFATDIKAYMQPNECLILNGRSSLGFKKFCRLVNISGWIDQDFYNNPDNDGNIGFGIFNFGDKPMTFEKGERVGQGYFTNYLVKDNDADDEKEVRVGGTGSTGTK